MIPEKRIKCVVVDDEPPALTVLEKHIESIPKLQLVASCGDAVEALEVLQKNSIDLIFLDIQMPQILGTDFVRSIDRSPKVIFTTAFRNYAVEGFELNAVDYLLKPISFERFLKAVSRIMNISVLAENAEIYNQEVQVSKHEYIYLKENRKTVKILLGDILFIESMNDYLKVVTIQKTFISKYTISNIAEQLENKGFIRIHRSFIIALNKVESFTNEIIQIGKYELPISLSYKHEVEKMLLR